MKWMITILFIVLFLLPMQGMAEVDEFTEPAVNESVTEDSVDDPRKRCPRLKIQRNGSGGCNRGGRNHKRSEDVLREKKPPFPEVENVTEDNQFGSEEVAG